MEPIAPSSQASISRPGAPKAYGVLSIIFGSIVLLFSLLGSCTQLAQKDRGQLTGALMGMGSGDPKGVSAAWDKYMATTRSVGLASSAVYLLMSGGLLIIGIGQLRYRRWARSSSVYWGLAALLVLAVVILVNRLIVAPAGRELFEALSHSSKGSLESMMSSMMGSMFTSSWFMIVTVILYAPYPLLLLATFTRPAIRDAMVD